MKLAVVTATPDLPKSPPVALLAGSFEERLRKARRYGFDGLELMVGFPAAVDRAATRRLLHENGLAAAAISTGALMHIHGLTLVSSDPQVRALALQRLHESIELAEALGAPVVTIGSFRGRLSLGGAQGMDMLREAMHTGAEWAGQHGAKLGLEACNRYELDWGNTAEQIVSLIKDVGSPHMGALLDTFHTNIEEVSPPQAVHEAMAGGPLIHVHLGDSNRWAAGLGHFDFAGFVDALKAAGYTGYLSAELLPKPGVDEAAQQTAAFMRPLIA